MRILVVSNEPFSDSSSNGRTIKNLMSCFKKEELAQFYIHGEPDYSVCDHYFCVSDSDALKAFKTGKRANGEARTQSSSVAKPIRPARERNAVTMIARDCIWNSMRWAGDDFYRWIDEFSPEVILLQAGDCAFMFRLARKLASRYALPLVIYNSESYYFKKYDYFCSSGFSKWLYPIFHSHFRKEFKKTIKQAQTSIYLCDKLKQDYDTEFDLPSDVIYTATQMSPVENFERNGDITISYLGNLGVGRHEGLIEIANALQMISPKLFLDVYGRIPNDSVGEAFEQCSGIRYKGFVSYDKVVHIMRSSDILVHTENFSDFYIEDLKYAFSTKIADTLASGVCFVLYAPGPMACTEYLTKNHAAYVISEKEELLPVLSQLIENPCARDKYILNALTLAQENHNGEKNATKFRKIIQNQLDNE